MTDDDLDDCPEPWRSEINRLYDQRNELEADNERLRAALQPFGVASDSYDDEPPARVIASKRGSILSVYDLRAAKAALG